MSVEELREQIKRFVEKYYAKIFLQSECGVECDQCHPFKIIECYLENKENILKTQKKEEEMGNQERFELAKRLKKEGLIPEDADNRRFSMKELEEIAAGKLDARQVMAGTSTTSVPKKSILTRTVGEGALKASRSDSEQTVMLQTIIQLLSDLHTLMMEDHRQIKELISSIIKIKRTVKSKPTKEEDSIEVDAIGDHEEEEYSVTKIINSDGDEFVLEELSRDILIEELNSQLPDVEWEEKDDEELREALVKHAEAMGLEVIRE